MFIPMYFSKEIRSKFQIIFDDVISKIKTTYPNLYFDNEFYLTSRCDILGCVDEDNEIILSKSLFYESNELIYIVIIHEIAHVINYTFTERFILPYHGFIFRKIHKNLMNEFLERNKDEELNSKIRKLISSTKLRKYYF